MCDSFFQLIQSDAKSLPPSFQGVKYAPDVRTYLKCIDNSVLIFMCYLDVL